MAATAEIWFRAMGTRCHVVMVGGSRASGDEVRRLLAELEAKWSRFLPTSELSQLNARPGRPVVLSAETFDAVSRAVEGWYVTAGRFDPSVLATLVASGYDRTFRQVMARSDTAATVGTPASPGPVPGCGDVVLLPASRAVVLPIGVTLDLGGIGKGLAADLVVAHMREAGVAGVCVNLGGDVRVEGEPPTDAGWEIAIEDPFIAGRELARVRLAGGAVVTTSRLRRRWTRGGVECHHLVDPATGRSAVTGIAALSVVTAEAAGGEVLAKAAFMAGPREGLALIRAAGAAGLIVHDDGVVSGLETLTEFAR